MFVSLVRCCLLNGQIGRLDGRVFKMLVLGLSMSGLTLDCMWRVIQEQISGWDAKIKLEAFVIGRDRIAVNCIDFASDADAAVFNGCSIFPFNNGNHAKIVTYNSGCLPEEFLIIESSELIDLFQFMFRPVIVYPSSHTKSGGDVSGQSGEVLALSESGNLSKEDDNGYFQMDDMNKEVSSLGDVCPELNMEAIWHLLEKATAGWPAHIKPNAFENRRDRIEVHCRDVPMGEEDMFYGCFILPSVRGKKARMVTLRPNGCSEEDVFDCADDVMKMCRTMCDARIVRPMSGWIARPVPNPIGGNSVGQRTRGYSGTGTSRSGLLSINSIWKTIESCITRWPEHVRRWGFVKETARIAVHCRLVVVDKEHLSGCFIYPASSRKPARLVTEYDCRRPETIELLTSLDVRGVCVHMCDQQFFLPVYWNSYHYTFPIKGSRSSREEAPPLRKRAREDDETVNPYKDPYLQISRWPDGVELLEVSQIWSEIQCTIRKLGWPQAVIDEAFVIDKDSGRILVYCPKTIPGIGRYNKCYIEPKYSKRDSVFGGKWHCAKFMYVAHSGYKFHAKSMELGSFSDVRWACMNLCVPEIATPSSPFEGVQNEYLVKLNESVVSDGYVSKFLKYYGVRFSEDDDKAVRVVLFEKDYTLRIYGTRLYGVVTPIVSEYGMVAVSDEYDSEMKLYSILESYGLKLNSKFERDDGSMIPEEVDVDVTYSSMADYGCGMCPIAIRGEMSDELVMPTGCISAFLKRYEVRFEELPGGAFLLNVPQTGSDDGRDQPIQLRIDVCGPYGCVLPVFSAIADSYVSPFQTAYELHSILSEFMPAVIKPLEGGLLPSFTCLGLDSPMCDMSSRHFIHLILSWRGIRFRSEYVSDPDAIVDLPRADCYLKISRHKACGSVTLVEAGVHAVLKIFKTKEELLDILFRYNVSGNFTIDFVHRFLTMHDVKFEKHPTERNSVVLNLSSSSCVRTLKITTNGSLGMVHETGDRRDILFFRSAHELYDILHGYAESVSSPLDSVLLRVDSSGDSVMASVDDPPLTSCLGDLKKRQGFLIRV